VVDLLGARLVDRRAGQRRDLLRQALAVEPDERRQVLATRGQAGLLERPEPRGDPRLDRVDEGSVEVEQDGDGRGKASEVGWHRPNGSARLIVSGRQSRP
jgi:hypothetical protein